MKNVKEIRDIFFNNIKDLFKRDSSFYILTNDADVHALKNLRSHSIGATYLVQNPSFTMIQDVFFGRKHCTAETLPARDDGNLVNR